MDFQWEKLVNEMHTRAPLLLQILSSIVSRNDHRRKWTGRAHYPSICMAISVLLKECNREMTGVQFIMSLMLFSSHAEKKIAIMSSNFIMQQYNISVYGRLNHVNVCVSYSAVLKLVGEIIKMHKMPVKQWIEEGSLLSLSVIIWTKKKRA